MPELRRIWEDVVIARDLGELGMGCLVCGCFGNLNFAHVTPRDRDGRDEYGRRHSNVVRVNPLDIVQLCGPPTDKGTCHHAFDNADIDLFPYLVRDYPEKILRCYERMGPEQGRQRLMPSDYRPAIERARREAVAA